MDFTLACLGAAPGPAASRPVALGGATPPYTPAHAPCTPSQVLSVGQEKRVSFWELREPSPLQWIDVGAEQTCVCRSSDGALFATAGHDHKVRVWHFESAKMVCEGIGHSRTVSAMQFSPDDKQLVSVGVDGSVLLWNVYV